MFVTQVDSAGTFSFFGWGVGGLGAWDGFGILGMIYIVALNFPMMHMFAS